MGVATVETTCFSNTVTFCKYASGTQRWRAASRRMHEAVLEVENALRHRWDVCIQLWIVLE